MDDRSNPDCPSISGTPIVKGQVFILFDLNMAAVGMIGGVTNLSEGMEFYGLMTYDGKSQIAAVQFFVIGKEKNGNGLFLLFATTDQFRKNGA